jgi:hypothetical protein
VGSVVWAKFESFPFWAALVSELEGNSDIDAETRKELNEQAGGGSAGGGGGGSGKSKGGSGGGSKKKGGGGASGAGVPKELVRGPACTPPAVTRVNMHTPVYSQQPQNLTTPNRTGADVCCCCRCVVLSPCCVAGGCT